MPRTCQGRVVAQHAAGVEHAQPGGRGGLAWICPFWCQREGACTSVLLHAPLGHMLQMSSFCTVSTVSHETHHAPDGRLWVKGKVVALPRDDQYSEMDLGSAWDNVRGWALSPTLGSTSVAMVEWAMCSGEEQCREGDGRGRGRAETDRAALGCNQARGTVSWPVGYFLAAILFQRAPVGPVMRREIGGVGPARRLQTWPGWRGQ